MLANADAPSDRIIKVILNVIDTEENTGACIKAAPLFSGQGTKEYLL